MHKKSNHLCRNINFGTIARHKYGPKHYHFADPKLSVSVDGDTVTVTAENFAKSVSVETENGVLRLDDNFVDMEAGTKTFRILPTADFTAEGTGVSGAYRVRSVYETAER